MGLIKNIFGALFGLVGAILKGILGVFGVGKKSEFYLELDESEMGNQPAAKGSVQAAPATAAASQPKQPAEPAQPAPAQPSPQPAVPAVAQVSQPVQAKPVAIPSFAANYLGGSNGVTMKRRRPGPSMAPFKDLAKQVRTSSGAR